MAGISSLVTMQKLRAICPSVRSDILEAILTDAPAAFAAAELTTAVRIAHFIAQIATETGGLHRLDENLNYTTTARLLTVFKALFPTEAAARPFLRNPEKLANHVYAGKLGNTQPGDGFAYRGSGLIQLTGRENFRKVGQLVGIDLENSPELARHPDSALQVALGYWTKRDINSVADRDTDAAVEAVTRRINSALLGLADRKSFFRKALKVLTPPAPVAQPAPAVMAGPAPMALTRAGATETAPAPTDIDASELSGPQWVDRFPTSRSIDDLAATFAAKVHAFVRALRDASADVSISATFRPKERAYLMHWAWEVGMRGLDPDAVPPMEGVAIRWSHPTASQSVRAAKQMVAAYGMVQIAALNSRHTERLAIDMTISWKGMLSIPQQGRQDTTIAAQPRNGSNPELIAVGRGYGVIKLPSDPPHWSDDGR